MLEKILSLPVDEKLGATATLRRIGEIPVVVVDHPRARAAVSLQGAQLLTWQPTGQEPVLWLSGKAPWTAGTPIRGGVPLCWPWFGEAGSPKHGFARTAVWELTGLQEGHESVISTLELRSSPESRAMWPHEFTLVCRITVGTECTVELDVRADESSVAALHTYLRVGDVGAVGVEGLGNAFTDGLRDHERGVQEGPVTPDPGGEFERYFTAPSGTASLRDSALARKVELHHPQASDVVVWNPGSASAQKMTDVPDGGDREFLCVESARLSRPLAGEGGEPSRLAVTLSVRDESPSLPR